MHDWNGVQDATNASTLAPTDTLMSAFTPHGLNLKATFSKFDQSKQGRGGAGVRVSFRCHFVRVSPF